MFVPTFLRRDGEFDHGRQVFDIEFVEVGQCDILFDDSLRRVEVESERAEELAIVRALHSYSLYNSLPLGEFSEIKSKESEATPNVAACETPNTTNQPKCTIEKPSIERI